MKSVGKQLEEARMARNWTPELASRETKIRVDRLRDLEADDFTHFSSPAYARGFVRTYARALNLDEYKILRQLDNKLPEDDHSTLVHESGIGYTAVPATPSRVGGPGGGSGLLVIMGLGFVISLVLGFVLFEAYRSGDLSRYFDHGSEASITPVTNATTAPARALPVDPNATTEAAKALPVDTNSASASAPVAAVTNEASATPAEIPGAAKALPVDPSELTNSPAPITPPATPPVAALPPVAQPASVADATNTPPRALPVDLTQLTADTNIVAAPVMPPAPRTTPISARASGNNSPILNDAGLPVVPTAASTAPADPSKRLVLTASHDSFLRVTAEDAADLERVLYASVLHAGQSVAFQGKKFSINVGVPSAVNITLDGVNYGPHSDEEAPETFTVESHQP